VNYELIIVRYGEIGLKAKATRRRFESTLVSNIKKALEIEKLSNEIKLMRGRIFVYTKEIKKSLSILQKIFGITSISPAIKTNSDMDSMKKYAVNISKKQMEKTDSFALRVTREGNHEYTSQDVAIAVGNVVRMAMNAKVNLTKPDFTLFIEIRNKDAYFYTDKLVGVGGLPLGTQGNVLSIIDTDRSILSSWYMMHRGCKIIYVSKNQEFNKKIEMFAKNWYAPSKIFTVTQDKDFFNNINKVAKNNKCDAIVTGHNIKNLENIKQFKEQINLPVLHPLIAMTEEQIQSKIKELGLLK